MTRLTEGTRSQPREPAPAAEHAGPCTVRCAEGRARRRRGTATSKRTRRRDAGTAPRPGFLKISDDSAELEDRQVHCDDQAPDHHAQKDDDDWLEQARKRRDRIIDLAFEKIGNLGQHAVERTPFLAK